MCSDAPDMTQMNEAAKMSAELGNKSFDWFTKEYEATRGQRDASTALGNQVANAQLEGMSFATDQAKEAAARSKAVFQPLQDKIVADAADFDTPGRRSQAAGEARADVEQSFGAAQQGLSRALGRSGARMGSGRSMALMQDAALDKAKAVAGATTNAVKGVEAQGYARKMDAAGLGMGVLGNQATQQQIASSTGGAAVGATSAANALSQSGAGLMSQGFNTALQGQGQAGSLYGQSANITAQNSGLDLGGLAALGQAGVSAYTAFSDERMKGGTGKPLSGKKARARMESMPVDEGWAYKTGSAADDGGQPHDGPMAADVGRAIPGARMSTPQGDKIDMVSIQGNLIAAVGDLSKDVKRLKARMGA